MQLSLRAVTREAVDAGTEASLVSMSAPAEDTKRCCRGASASALPKALGCQSLLVGPVGWSGFQAWCLSQPLGAAGQASLISLG